MYTRRIRRAGVTVAAALAAVALTAAEARAYSNSYCGVLLNSGSWCGDGSNHSYDSNRATYSGTGNVWVCERLLWADSTSLRTSPHCAYNRIDYAYGLTTDTYFEAEVKHESGTARHTISGYAVY